ncbi:MAG: FAD-binding protein, partial [Actinobacteria bacterium]|nr:FAD-binding protein [Actinomycetota bacterium]
MDDAENEGGDMTTTSRSRIDIGVTTNWSNWAGNQRVSGVLCVKPSTEDELRFIVESAVRNNQRVKAIGAGHSFTGIAKPEELLVDLSSYRKVIRIDKSNMTVEVESGIQLWVLNEVLHEHGLAMQNLGDIAYQTIAGAISTSTHGTGAKFTGIA